MSVALRQCWGLAVAVVVTLILAATPQPAHAGTDNRDPRAEREQLRSQRAAVVADVDALHATNEEITKALEALQANVGDERALLDDAVRVADHHDWFYYDGIEEHDWPRHARLVAACLRSDQIPDDPTLKKHFDRPPVAPMGARLRAFLSRLWPNR